MALHSWKFSWLSISFMVKAQFLPLWLGKPFIFWCPVQIPLRAYPGPGPAGLLAVSPAHQARSLLRVLFLLPRIMALCFLSSPSVSDALLPLSLVLICPLLFKIDWLTDWLIWERESEYKRQHEQGRGIEGETDTPQSREPLVFPLPKIKCSTWYSLHLLLSCHYLTSTLVCVVLTFSSVKMTIKFASWSWCFEISRFLNAFILGCSYGKSTST